MRQLILSSSSPARRALLSRLPMPFTAISPDVDETALAGETAEALVKRLAELKAKAASALYPDTIIIGSDQVGVLDGRILCKPLTHANAVEQLLSVSHKTVRFYTGLYVLDALSKKFEYSLATYDVSFKPLTLEMIENYLRIEEALHCAGSFQAEGLGIALIEKFNGDDYTALIGLPLIQLVTSLEKLGVDVLASSN
jgi:septum formation protein